MLNQSKILFDTEKLRSIFNWNADLESGGTSPFRLSRIKLAAFMRTDFPVIATDHLEGLYYPILSYYMEIRHLASQEIKALLTYYENYCQPLINVTVVDTNCLSA